jgi:hypothetical protein
MSSRWIQRRSVHQTAPRRLVDEAMDRYVEWREASAEVGEAYGRWSNAPGGQGAVSFAAYTAALDREEWAATLYGAVIDRAERLLGAEFQLAGAEQEAA